MFRRKTFYSFVWAKPIVKKACSGEFRKASTPYAHPRPRPSHMIPVCLGACRRTKGEWMISKGKVVASHVVDWLKSHKLCNFPRVGHLITLN